VTYTVSDAAGNAATPVVRTVNVVPVGTPDVTRPIVTAPANKTVSATDANGTPATHSAIVTFLNSATASDNVDGTIPPTNNSPVLFPLGVTTVTFSATDSSGNTGTAQATVTVVDQTPPVITLLGASSIKLYLGNAFVDPGSSVSDNVDAGLIATVTGSVDPDQIGVYTLTYNATDTAGNVALVTRSVSVQEDVFAQNPAPSGVGGGGGGGSLSPFMILLLLVARLFKVRTQGSTESGGRKQSTFN
jgi:hypothetical protein